MKWKILANDLNLGLIRFKLLHTLSKKELQHSPRTTRVCDVIKVFPGRSRSRALQSDDLTLQRSRGFQGGNTARKHENNDVKPMLGWCWSSVVEGGSTQNICITFIQCRPSIFDFGPTLYKCYTNVLRLLGQHWVKLGQCWSTAYETCLENQSLTITLRWKYNLFL